MLSAGGHGRDPLVLSTSKDGVAFDSAFVVVRVCPPLKPPSVIYCGTQVLQNTNTVAIPESL